MIKGLIEKRNNLITEMEGLVAEAKTKERALEEKEITRIDEIKVQIRSIDATIKADEDMKNFEKSNSKEKKREEGTDTEEEIKTRSENNFLDFVRGNERALGVGSNGGIVPTHIANKIIEKVKEISPIYQLADVYNVNGKLKFPKYGLDGSNDIKATYVDEFQELVEKTGKFTVVELNGYVVGCLAKVSKSLVNNTEFDLLSYVITKVAKAISEFLEQELIKGTSGKMEGAMTSTNILTSSIAAKVDADDLIDLQLQVPQVYQKSACWIMHKNTVKALRKLKNADGDYLLTKSLVEGFSWDLLGKPVHISESCDDTIATGKKPILYGDFAGLAVKLTQNLELQVLVEKFATQHALGIVGYIEADSKVIDEQKIAVLAVK